MHGTPGQIVASGGFFQNELFRTMVEKQAGVRLTMPDLPPVHGACVEALRSEGVSVSQNFHQNFWESYRMI